MTGQRRIPVFIEATPLLDPRMSGIGHMLLHLIHAVARRHPELDLILVVPFDKMRILKERTQDLAVSYRPIVLPAKVVYGLMKFNILPPLDMVLGKGVYLFPNFRNWPLLRSKSITYIHDLAFRIFPEFIEPKNGRFLRRNMNGWLQQTDYVVAVSRCTKKDVEKYYSFPADKIEVIYNGIDQHAFYPQPIKDVESVKRKYGINGDYLIFVSTIEPRKNIDTLLEAYSQLPESVHKKYALVLIGSSGWLNQKTVKHIEDLRAAGLRVIWPRTFVPDNDLPSLLSGASLLVHPAYYEGFGITPLEAMAVGTPVLVANNSSLPEVVGKAGLYFKTEDPFDLQEKIGHLLQNTAQRTSLSQEGKKRAASFTWEAASDRLVSLIKRVNDAGHK